MRLKAYAKYPFRDTVSRAMPTITPKFSNLKVPKEPKKPTHQVQSFWACTSGHHISNRVKVLYVAHVWPCMRCPLKEPAKLALRSYKKMSLQASVIGSEAILVAIYLINYLLQGGARKRWYSPAKI